MILFDEPHLKIEFKNIPCRHLVTTWYGSTRSQQYKDGINTILKCCRENEIRKIVNDIRHQDRITDEDERYAFDQFQEYVSRHGFFFQANLLASDVFLKFSAANFERGGGKQNYRVNQFFSNDLDAMNWLMDVDS
jgi:hypothetical protein